MRRHEAFQHIGWSIHRLYNINLDLDQYRGEGIMTSISLSLSLSHSLTHLLIDASIGKHRYARGRRMRRHWRGRRGDDIHGNSNCSRGRLWFSAGCALQCPSANGCLLSHWLWGCNIIDHILTPTDTRLPRILHSWEYRVKLNIPKKVLRVTHT